MSTTVKRKDGGYATFANRWIDAGYMAAAPGSVTKVYLFLCRWADNTTLESAQPMRTISRMCGVTENVARTSVRALEAWNVMHRDPDSGKHAKNAWTLLDLPLTAPPYPGNTPIKQDLKKVDPLQKVGVPESAPHINLSINQPLSSSSLRSEEECGDTSPPTPTDEPKPKKSKTANNRGSRIPEPFKVTEGMRAFAQSEGLSDWQIDRETDKFVDHFASAPGSRGVKLDWVRTWRNWMRGESDKKGHAASKSSTDNGGYIAIVGPAVISRIADLLDDLDPGFGGEPWVRHTLRRLSVEVPGLSPDRLKAGIDLGYSRIDTRLRNRNGLTIASPTGFAYGTFRSALQEQADGRAA